MSSGLNLRGQYNRQPAGPTVKYWLLHQELQKRGIRLVDFARALDVDPRLLKGSGRFPMDKIGVLVQLLNNWHGARRPLVKNVRLVQPEPVSKEMLVTILPEL